MVLVVKKLKVSTTFVTVNVPTAKHYKYTDTHKRLKVKPSEKTKVFIIINMQYTEKTVYLTDESLPHTLCYPSTTHYNVRRLLRNYYNYSFVCFHFVKSQTNLYKRTPKHPRQP